MPIEYQYDRDENVLKCVASGALQIDEIIAYFDEVSRRDLRPGCVEFADMSSLSVIYINYQDNKRLTRAYARMINNGCLGTVMYAPQKLTRSICETLASVFGQTGFRLLVITERSAVDAAIAELRSSA